MLSVALAVAACARPDGTPATAELFPPIFSPLAVVTAANPAVATIGDKATPATQAAHLTYETLRQAALDRQWVVSQRVQSLKATIVHFTRLSTEYDNRLLDGIAGSSPELQAKHAALGRVVTTLSAGVEDINTALMAARRDGEKLAELQAMIVQARQQPSASDDQSQQDFQFLADQLVVLDSQIQAQQAAFTSESRQWPTQVTMVQRYLQNRRWLPASSATSPTVGPGFASVTLPPPPQGVEQGRLLLSITFDSPTVDYARLTRRAVSAMAGAKGGTDDPAVRYSLIALTTQSDDPSASLRALNIQQIIADTGVALDHITVYGHVDGSLSTSQVRIYLSH